MYHLTYSYSSLNSVKPVDRLFPAGYVVSALIFLVLSITTHFQNAKTTAIISFIMTLTLSFDIASLWLDLSKGSAACNIILAVILLYVSAKTLFQKYRTPKPKSETESSFSHDYMTVGYVASALSFGIFAIDIFGVSAASRHSFMWVTSSGILYFLSAVAALRRNDSVSGGYFSLLGAFWLAISYNLSLSGSAAFASFYINGVVPSLAVYIFFIISFLCFAIISIRRQLFQSFHSFIMSLFCVSYCVDGLDGTFIGTVCWLGLVLSLYGLAAYSFSTNTLAGDYQIPLGDSIFQTQTMMNFMSTRLPMFRKLVYGKLKGSSKTELFSTDTMLGYAKYGDFDMLGFGANAIAALSIIFVSGRDAVFTVPWVVGLGGIIQFWVGAIGFARGKTFESCSFMVFSIFWSIWGTVRAMNLIPTAASTGTYVGCVCFLIVGVLMMFIASVTNKAWVVLSFFFNLLILSFMLQCFNISNTDLYETVIVIVFSLVCLYMFTASALKAIWQRDVIPLGSPLLQVNYLHSQGIECTWADARTASGVKVIAGKSTY